ncbi:MAG: UDP-glucose 4-epimerase GalE [Nitrospiraceae bacterium]
MRVLVTGGAGYIGSVVAEQLIGEGHHVVVYDNLSKGHRDAVSNRAVFVHGDLLDNIALGRTLQEEAVDGVVHMAADSLVGESVLNPAKYYRTNVQGGLALLDAMLKAGVRSVVFSSTAAVYGEPAKQPIEETDPTCPTNPYGESKLAFERALAWYGNAYGLRAISLRYFNAAGATALNGERHNPETHLIPLVLQAALTGRDVTVFGDDYPTKDGTCVRDYIHVQDLATAHLLALKALSSSNGNSATFNLGCGGEGYTVREVIEVARQVTSRDVPLKIGARRPGDPAVLIAGSQRINRELGWRPALQNLQTIVESAWAWMRQRAGSP